MGHTNWGKECLLGYESRELLHFLSGLEGSTYRKIIWLTIARLSAPPHTWLLFLAFLLGKVLGK